MPAWGQPPRPHFMQWLFSFHFKCYLLYRIVARILLPLPYTYLIFSASLRKLEMVDISLPLMAVISMMILAQPTLAHSFSRCIYSRHLKLTKIYWDFPNSHFELFAIGVLLIYFALYHWLHNVYFTLPLYFMLDIFQSFSRISNTSTHITY